MACEPIRQRVLTPYQNSQSFR